MARRKPKPAPSLLDEAIAKYKIPRWPYQPTGDRVVVYSVPEDAASRETYSASGTIIKPQTRRSRDVSETPRGILCAAGLTALDSLRSHGYALGQMVWVARLSPWRHEVDRDEDGKVIEFLFLRSGDMVGSEELVEHIRAGRASVELRADGTHAYKFEDEAARPRFDPPSFVA